MCLKEKRKRGGEDKKERGKEGRQDGTEQERGEGGGGTWTKRGSQGQQQQQQPLKLASVSQEQPQAPYRGRTSQKMVLLWTPRDFRGGNVPRGWQSQDGNPVRLDLRADAWGFPGRVQWLRICLPMQGIWVQSLLREDPTCRGEAGPMCHNYRACTPRACAPRQEKPPPPEACALH